MIDQTLQFIKSQLIQDPTLNLGTTEIIAENLHKLTTDINSTGLFYSLVNIEEEGTLKNSPNYIKINNQLRRIQPPIVLNLYVLFAFKLSNYNTSILKLSQLISYFQTNRWFTFNNVTDTQHFNPPIDRIIFELYNTNFEQLNHIWSILGGNHHPSVLYKVRVVKVQRNEHVEAPEINTIEVNSGVSN
jgi:hypothetical protein